MSLSELVSALFLVTFLATSIQADCDLNTRLNNCREAAGKIANSQCSALPFLITTVTECFDGCDETTPNYAEYYKELEGLFRQINSTNRCAERPAEARDARQGQCNFFQVTSCLSNLGGITSLPTNADFSSLKGICASINTVAGFLDSCGVLVTDCVALGLGNVFATQLNSIRSAINLGKELQNGGCTCITNIEQVVVAYSSLPSSSSALAAICPAVQTTTRAVKVVLDTCINTINQQLGGAQLDWLSITIGYINVINPSVTFVCNTIGLLNAAASIGLGFLTVLAAVLFNVINRFRTLDMLLD